MRVMPDLPATMLAQPVCDIVCRPGSQAKAGDDDSASCQDALLTENKTVFCGKVHVTLKQKHRKTRWHAGRVAGGRLDDCLPLARQREP